MEGYGVSPMGSHGVVGLSVSLSVSQSVGQSVGRNQSVKQSVRKKEKNVFPVTGRLVIICKEGGKPKAL